MMVTEKVPKHTSSKEHTEGTASYTREISI